MLERRRRLPMPPIDVFIRAGRPDTTEALRAYATRRLSFTLRRFHHVCQRVTVRLVDLNGPRRGVDARCSITADLADGRRLYVDATRAWPFAAITDAARRLAHVVSRTRRGPRLTMP